MKKVIAILCSDLHLSHRPPSARSGEEDWYEVMRRQLIELGGLKDKYCCPIIVAGDVFDKYNSPPELMNFALAYLPDIYCVPGQHDLYQHNLDEMDKSAYHTLVMVGRIVHLPTPYADLITGGGKEQRGLVLHGFPWGVEITSLENPDPDRIHLAVIHKYCWTKNHGYPGAPEDNKLGAFRKQLKGYDAAVFGDNHMGFLAVSGDCTVLNAGTFYRRHQDEKGYKPHVGLLHEDGSITLHYMDVSQDKFIEENEPIIEHEMNMDGFLEELEELSSDPLDFREALRHYVEHKGVSSEVGKIVLGSME